MMISIDRYNYILPTGMSNKKMGSKEGAIASNTRDRILEAAKTVFSRKGFAASIREIAKESQTTLPSLYHYFGSKEGLFQELMREQFEKVIGLINIDDETGSARKNIKRSAMDTYRFMIENVDLLRLMLLQSYGRPEGAPRFDFEPYYKLVHELNAAMIRRGIRNGEFRRGDVDDMAWVIRGAIQAAADDLCFFSERKIDERKLDRILDMILDGFLRAKDKK